MSAGCVHRELRTRWRQDSLGEGKASTSPTEYGNGAAQWAINHFGNGDKRHSVETTFNIKTEKFGVREIEAYLNLAGGVDIICIQLV
ncbi:MAG: hypothetical protein FVQ80_18370 [Planctomycetes bacterium]|nr:hypothetical protein [Planctomycetota bacterium]